MSQSFTIAILLASLWAAGPASALDLFSRLSTPGKPFDEIQSPPAPDYDNPDFWAALPDRVDNADIVPDGSGEEDNQVTAMFDVFYVHPTSYIFGSNWNAAADDWLAGLITDLSMLPQQAAVYNGVARVYAPRYRQASQGAQVNPMSQADLDKALALAYDDVQRAFDYYLEHYNNGRPFLIASHSQGTTHTVPLLQYLFKEHPKAATRMVAGYLIGNTVVEARLKPYLPVCDTPTRTGCYLSWNSIAEGGDDSHWQSTGKPVCVNPLSWRRDGVKIGREHNLGSLPITGPFFLDAPDKKTTGARCENGILWIDVPTASGYSLFLFPGGGYHAYDYNLFWINIRANLRERTQAWLAMKK